MITGSTASFQFGEEEMRKFLTMVAVALFFSISACAAQTSIVSNSFSPRAGVVVTLGDTAVDVDVVDGNDNDIAQFMIEFEITAYGEDWYIPFGGGCPKVAGFEQKHPAVECQIETIFGIYEGGVRFVSLDSTADEFQGYFVVRRGATETFAIVVAMQNTDGDAGSYRLRMTGLNYRNDPSKRERWYHHPVGPEWKTPFVNVIN